MAASSDGETERGEWDRHGRHAVGSRFAMGEVTIVVVRDGLIAEARLYMEPVDVEADDIDASVRRLYQPPIPPSQ